MMGGKAVTFAMLPPPPTKPITLPLQRGFIEGEKVSIVRQATF